MWLKWADFALLGSPKLIYGKSEWYKNHEISTLCATSFLWGFCSSINFFLILITSVTVLPTVAKKWMVKAPLILFVFGNQVGNPAPRLIGLQFGFMLLVLILNSRSAANTYSHDQKRWNKYSSKITTVTVSHFLAMAVVENIGFCMTSPSLRRMLFSLYLIHLQCVCKYFGHQYHLLVLR